MKSTMIFIAVVAALMLQPMTAIQATGVGDCTVHLNGGADVAYIGQTNTIEFWITNDAPLDAMSIAFEFTIGRDFAFNPNHGNKGYVDEAGSAVGAFNLGGLQVNATEMDDISPDRILFGGASMGGGGLPQHLPGELCYTMEFDILPGQLPLNNGLRIDNIYFPPAGTWLFHDAGGNYAPDFQGNPNPPYPTPPSAPPVFFDIMDPLSQLDQFQDDHFIGHAGNKALAQTFTVGISGQLCGVSVFLEQTPTPATTRIEIWTTNGGVPDTYLWGTAYNGTALPPPTGDWVYLNWLNGQIYVSAGDVLAIVVRPANPANSIAWYGAWGTNPYAGGEAFSGDPDGTNWQPLSGGGQDLAFETYMKPFSTIDMVPVNNLNNPPDFNGVGRVNYNYEISTHEITNEQYTEFLNAVARLNDQKGLYNSNMTTGWGGIEQNLYLGRFQYKVEPAEMANKPVNFVSWLDATRFCNWLHNGRPTTGSWDINTTETGGYDLTISEPDRYATRSFFARYALPTEDEWYKSAYYDPITSGGYYWRYPYLNDADPICATANAVGDISNPGPRVINFDDCAVWNGFPNVTTVGSAGPSARSYYETYDQGGNVWEWTEWLRDWGTGYVRGVAGGAFNEAYTPGTNNWGVGMGPNLENQSHGFRIVRPPLVFTFQLFGTSNGDGYSWSIVIYTGPKAGQDKSGETYMLTTAASPPDGSDAETFVSWMVASIDSVTGPEINAEQDPVYPWRFTISSTDATELMFSVGQYGQIPDCVVDEDGCSFNPTIQQVDPDSPPYICGDADANGIIEVSDPVYLIAYIFLGGSAPDPYEAGDAYCDGVVDISDVVYLIAYIFQGGPAPCNYEPCSMNLPEVGAAEKSPGHNAVLTLSFDNAGRESMEYQSVNLKCDTEVAGVQLEFEVAPDIINSVIPHKTDRSEELDLFWSVTDGLLKVGLIDMTGERGIAAGSGEIIELELNDVDPGKVKLIHAVLADRQARSIKIIITQSDKSGNLPETFALEQNYPNPFNPSTEIAYSLPEPSQVRLEVYNVLGQRVKTLIDSYQATGNYSIEWNGTNNYEQLVPSGVYFYRIHAGEFTQSKKMMLLK